MGAPVGTEQLTRYTLRVIKGDAPGYEIEIGEPVEVGRDPGAGLPLTDDAQASARHARVTPASGGLLVEDLGSRNGTLVDGVPIESPTVVRPGQRIQLGDTFLEVVRASAAPEYVLAKADGGREVRLAGPLEVGRDPSADLALVDDHLVSGRHARLTPLPDGVAVEDLGSRNGTFVNDSRIEAPTLVKPGERVTIGDTTFELRAAPSPSYVLEVVKGGEPGRSVPIDALTPLEIGRHRASGLALPEDELVSSHHARVSSGADGVSIEDLGSRNGTIVNGRPIDAPTHLEPGDEVLIGGTLLALRRDGAGLGGATVTRPGLPGVKERPTPAGPPPARPGPPETPARRAAPLPLIGALAVLLLAGAAAGIYFGFFNGGGSSSAGAATNGEIAWSGVPGRNADIYVMDRDAKHQRNITSSPWDEIWVDWSPDGSRIAFASNRDGNFEIYLINPDGTGLTRLTKTKSDNYQLAWSPDGSRIAFTSGRDGNENVYVMNADGTGQRRLTASTANDRDPAWSPDGAKLLFTSDRALQTDVYVMNVDGTDQRDLTNNPAGDAEAVWSPDGKKIAFASNRGGNGDIWVMSPDGSEAKQLTTDPKVDLGPGWSPDSKKIVFTALRHGQDEIYEMNPDGSSQRRLTKRAGSDVLPAWQPRGEKQAPPLASSALAPAARLGRLPQLRISDVAGIPGSAAVFAVTMRPASKRQVTVSYVVNPGLPDQCRPFACATPGKDYIARSGVLIFKPGETAKTIVVPLINDGRRKPNQVFVGVLAVALHATEADNLGAGKITNQGTPYELKLAAKEYTAGFRGHGGGLVLGPDNRLWTTEQFDDKLASFDVQTHRATEYRLPPGVYPHFIMVGPDKNLWFTDLFDRIGRFDLKTHRATMFEGMPIGSAPHFLLLAPDGTLYFSAEGEERIPQPGGQNRTRQGQSRIGQFDPQTHVFRMFTAGIPRGGRLHGMIIGPDGQLWIALEAASRLGRFNLGTKKIDKWVQLEKGSGPHDLLTGPDGKIYIVQPDAGEIGSYDPKTGQIREYHTSLTKQDGNSLVFLTVGPDKHSLWFSEFLNDRVGKVDLRTGRVTEYTAGITPGSAPIGIVVGPDKNVWFSEPVLDTRVPGRMAELDLSQVKRFSTAERSYVGRLYRDLAGHEVSAAPLAKNSALLSQGTADRFQIALAVGSSQDAKALAITRVYLGLLGRRPTPRELTQAFRLLRKSTIFSLEVTLAASPEYFTRRALGTNEGFIAALYGDLLGRAPKPNDRIAYAASAIPGRPDQVRRAQAYPADFSTATANIAATVPQIQQTSLSQLRRDLAAGAGRRSIAIKLITSEERLHRLAGGLAGRFLFRSASSATVTRYVKALERGLSLTHVVAAIVSSSQYTGLGEMPPQR